MAVEDEKIGVQGEVVGALSSKMLRVELLPPDLMPGHSTFSSQLANQEHTLKVRPSVKPMCERCRVIKRHGRTMVICTNPRHKQRQG